jgi:ketol-acid reductoisomerase
MTKINFGGVMEEVTTRLEFPLKKARKILKNEIVAVIGYGVQGPAQAMNLRDNGLTVIIGQREGSDSWEKAVADGWRPGKNLFPIEEAVKRGTIIAYLLSDAGQIALWPKIKPYLTAGKTLYFSHGFAITFKKNTRIIPPKNIDVILVAPKGSGKSVRRLFLAKKGINSSLAVFQNYSGRAWDKVKAMGIGIGSGYLFKTTFEKEVYSDLTGERGVLMGALTGIMEAQYQILRQNGHSPSEAFNETVEEATQSLIPLISESGMDWMYANCSTTAQRGALDWRLKFKKAVLPVFKKLYQSVKTGREAKIVIAKNSRPDYRKELKKELNQMKNSEMWRAGAEVRKLRP